jgi:hypothetical protein
MDDKELKQLAIDISEGKVFGTFHMNEHQMSNMSCVFMPLVFMKEEQRQELIDKKVAHFYEYIDQAGPRSVNGMPCFFSMRNISQDDWSKVVKYIKEYESRVKTFLDKEEKQEPEGPTLFDEVANED